MRDARPIAKGRLGKPAGFGYKAQVTGNDDGVIPGYTVKQGNPADGPQLAPAVAGVIKQTGKSPEPLPQTAAVASSGSKTTACTRGSHVVIEVPHGPDAAHVVRVTLLVVRNQRILATWDARQAENARRAAAGLPPRTRKRRRKTLSVLATATRPP